MEALSKWIMWRLRDEFWENNLEPFHTAILTIIRYCAWVLAFSFVFIRFWFGKNTKLSGSRLSRLIMPAAKERPDVASNACASCKMRKRRCDKKLPRCLECTKKKRRCDYNYVKRNSPLTSETSDSYQEKNVSTHSMSSASTTYALPSSNFPSLFFLDPSVFHNHNIDIPRASVSLPSYVAGELGSGQEHEYIGRIFFKTIHKWFPIVSRKRFCEELRASSKGPGVTADLGFLLLTMRLITWHPSSSEDDDSVEEKTARTATYRAAKQFGFELEAAGLFSLQILQGMLLVALYEIGHAIYPAAFMSIAACVRYARALGIQPGGLQRLKLPLTWVEEEERKRVWWSAFLLDRFVSLSCPGSPAAIDEPDPGDHLPTDDSLWDEGAKKVPCSPLLHSPVSMEFGRFALVIQAFVLMSKVPRLTSPSRDGPLHLLKDEVQQLERTVKALLYFGRIECKWRNGLPSCELHAVSQMSLIAIYTSSTVPVEMPDNFIESLADILDASNYEQLIADAHHGQDEISPFLIQLLYQTSVILLRKERPRNGDWGETRVEKLKSALWWLDKRWKLAGVFHQALEAQQIALSRDRSLADAAA